MSTTTSTMTKESPRSISRVYISDWTGQKRVPLNGTLVTGDVTVGELAEAGRKKLRAPRGAYAIYHQGEKLDRAATLEEAGIAQDAELELNPEVKAGGARRA